MRPAGQFILRRRKNECRRRWSRKQTNRRNDEILLVSSRSAVYLPAADHFTNRTDDWAKPIVIIIITLERKTLYYYTITLRRTTWFFCVARKSAVTPRRGTRVCKCGGHTVRRRTYTPAGDRPRRRSRTSSYFHSLAFRNGFFRIFFVPPSCSPITE